MSYHFTSPILDEEFIADFLLYMSNEADAFRREQPDYAVFLRERKRWNDTMEQFGEDVPQQFDNEVLPAFLEYQKILETHMISKRLTDGFHRRPLETKAEIPGLAKAGTQLEKVCTAFSSRFQDETDAQCIAYLKLRRETIGKSRNLCRQCGAEGLPP
jgi:hypothetical protein